MRFGWLVLASLLLMGADASANRRPPDFVSRARTEVRQKESRTRQEYVTGMKRAASALFGAAVTGEMKPGALVEHGGKQLVLVRKSYRGNWAAIDTRGELHEVKVEEGAITSAAHVSWRRLTPLMNEHGAYHKRDVLQIVERAAGLKSGDARYGQVANVEVSRLNAKFKLERRVELGRRLPALTGVAPELLDGMTEAEVEQVEHALGHAGLSSPTRGVSYTFDSAIPGKVSGYSDFVPAAQMGRVSSGRMPDVVYHVTARGKIEKRTVNYAQYSMGNSGAPYYRTSDPDVAVKDLPSDVAASMRQWMTQVRGGL